MFLHTPYPNAVLALDLTRPGHPLKWKYVMPSPPPARKGAAPPPFPILPTGCCDVGSRGLAWHRSGKVYVPLLNGELAALDAATGREIWRVRNTDPRLGGTLSGAPLVVHDLVLVGQSGSEAGVRGQLSAYNALTGQLMWRGWSTGPDADVLLGGPANVNYGSHQVRDLGVFSWLGQSWQRGGGTASGWIAWDSTLDLVYYGTDAPAPPDPVQRTGDNKWTATILAREARTGRVRWAYQVTPHDQWGYGASNESILADLTVRGVPVRALVHFDRNGFAYTLDRATGKVLVAEKYGPANWARSIDLTSGLPVLVPPAPAAAGRCPAAIGTKFLQPAAYSFLTRLFYLPLNNVCQDVRTAAMVAGPGGNRGRFLAWDATTAAVAWEVREPLPVAGGALATAGGVVFYGTLDGWLKALDQRTGRELWRAQAPSGIVGNPISYLGPDGKQYLAVYTGRGGWWMQAAGIAPADSIANAPTPGTLLVFALP